MYIYYSQISHSAPSHIIHTMKIQPLIHAKVNGTHEKPSKCQLCKVELFGELSFICASGPTMKVSAVTSGTFPAGPVVFGGQGHPVSFPACLVIIYCYHRITQEKALLCLNWL